MKICINLFAGLFFLIGVLISYKKKNSKSLINFSLGNAFTVLIYLLLFDIIPEAYESFNDKITYLIIGIIIGIILLVLLDKIIPHHDHYDELKRHDNHLNHIGIMTSLALIIHNIVEGMSIYIIASSSIKAGIICVIGVGMHNIPFGIEITTLLNKMTNNKMWIYITLLTLSTFIGGIFIYLFESILNNFIMGILLSISTGMIIYLLLFELLLEIKETFNKYTIFGGIFGIIVMILSEIF